MLWHIETDAEIYAAQSSTGHHAWSAGGRLGVEATTDHPTAMQIVATLHEHGRKAWMSPAPGTRPADAASEGLRAYAQGRDGLVEAVHAGLEAGLTKAQIAREAGLSRMGLDKIIDRYGLDALVKGK